MPIVFSKMTKLPDHLVLFDGVCNLCNRSVLFILKRDRKGIFLFAPLQSRAGHSIREQFQISSETDSIIYIEKGSAHITSEAALRIAMQLGRVYKISNFFLIIPLVIRDAVYDLIARNRYQWFGRRNHCMIPAPEIKDRFIEAL